jgi:uncharacterized membrane protein HdeD (DUF308 family)
MIEFMVDLSETNPARIPIVIGVTGHRDLVDGEVGQIRDEIARLFHMLRDRFPATPLRVMSSLAEGADRVAAEVALDHGIPVQAVLPMPAVHYRDDFGSEDSKSKFDELCRQSEIMQIPLTESEIAAANASADSRAVAYAQAGMFISAHCHVLLAIWDGRSSDKVGGTAQIVYFQHYDRLSGIAETVPRTSLFLTDDESDLVFHIHCSRQGAPGEPGGRVYGEWFTADADNPRTPELPDRYELIFDRTNEFNRDIANWQASGRSFTDSIGDPPDTDSRHAAAVVAGLFKVADTLANRFQRQVSRSLGLIYVLAILTGLAFLVYSELDGFDSMIFVFLALLVTGIFVAAVAGKREWHRKYLEYRVLAEGLRVQYYWTVAGIHGDGHTKFAYDNFLRQRDMELGWIRNVMRVAGVPGDTRKDNIDVPGLAFAVEEWIGTPDGQGQLAYYRHKARHRHKANVLTQRLTLACLWSGIAAACVLAFLAGDSSEAVKDRLIILMGILPLIAGVAEAYTQRKANRELSKQYQFMERVFLNAHRRIAEARNDRERREVLLGLGEAALTEHAEWILTHREREPGSTQL